MLTRILLAFSVCLGLAWSSPPCAAQAPLQGEVRRIGLLGALMEFQQPPFQGNLARPLVSSLAELGWNESRVVFILRSAGGKDEDLPRLAAELVALKVDLIAAFDAESTRAAMRATRTVPIVFPLGHDAIAEGLVTDLARPGGNVTGISAMSPDIWAKELALAKEAMPDLRRVGVVMDDAIPTGAAILRAMRETAQARGIELHVVPFQPYEGFAERLARLRSARVQALTGNVTSPKTMEPCIRFAREQRIPLLGYTDAPPGLLSFELDVVDAFRRAAYLMDRILRGAQPGHLPVEQPTKFRLLINLRTADEFRINLPQALLLRADEVIR